MEKECVVCGDINTIKHHVFEGTANRKISDKLKAIIYLCPKHHNMSDEGIHFNKKLELQEKRKMQLKLMLKNEWYTVDDWIEQTTLKNYLWRRDYEQTKQRNKSNRFE